MQTGHARSGARPDDAPRRRSAHSRPHVWMTRLALSGLAARDTVPLAPF